MPMHAYGAQFGVKGYYPLCEPEGLSPDGGLSYSTIRNPHQTGEPWHLLCHGGKTRPGTCRPMPMRASAEKGAGL